MTDEELRAMLAEAAPGPWEWAERHPTNATAEVFMAGGEFSSLATLYCCGDNVPRPASPDEPWGDHPIRRATARLIAATPDLAAEVLRLRERVAELEAAR